MDLTPNRQQAGRRLALVAAASAVWPWLAQAQPLQAPVPVAPPSPAAPAAQRKPWPAHTATPALQLPLADGTPWSLAAHKGQPVLLNFWASWCEPCRAEMPALQELAARHQARGLQLVAVNFKESEASVQRFLQATGLQLPVLRDADGAAAQAFGVHIFPSTVAINRRGQAVFSIVGECDWGSAVVDRWVQALL